MGRHVTSLAVVAALAVIGTSLPAPAATFNDFDGGGTPTPWVGASNNAAYMPAVQAMGGMGNYLRLLYDAGSLLNTAAFDQTDAGSVVTDIQFDFRLSDEATYPGGQQADGFSVSVIGTATYGATGALPTGATNWERPQFADSVAIGFDIYEGGGNNVYSLNANGSEIATNTINDSVFQMTTGVWNRANIAVSINPAAYETTVSMSITPDINGTPGTPVNVFTNQALANVLPPRESRLAFGGRTGGERVSVDLDNVQANFVAVAPYPAPPVNPPTVNPVTQDHNFYEFQDPNTGNYNVYEVRGWGNRYGGTEDMYNALLAARGRSFSGATGDLTSVGSAAENAFLHRIANRQDAWLGLTDSSHPAFATTEGTFVWTNGQAVTYTNFGGGEPNDAAPGEDATYIRSDGAWNDHGSGILGETQVASPGYRYIIKYATDSATPLLTPAPGEVPGVTATEGQWSIREVINNGGIGSIAAVRNSLSGGGTIVDYTADTLNIQDSGGGGNYPNDDVFGVVTAGHMSYGSVDNISLLAKRRITVPPAGAGRYTFAFNSDDGGELTLRNASTGTIVPFELKAGASETIVGTHGTLIHDFGRGVGNSFGQIALPAGQYDVEMLYWEGSGGSAVEVFMGKGDQTTFRNMQLVGGPPPPHTPKLIGPHGPGGTWVAYERDGTARTFPDARTEAEGRDFHGIPGNLVTVGTGEENQFVYRSLGTGWIGLTDEAGPEAGNTSGQPIPINAVPGPGQRGEGFQWTSGEPFTRSRWNGGEPNDSGGEDYIEITGALWGAWNDLPTSYTRPSTIEYNLGAPTKESIMLPGFLVTVHKATDGNMRTGGDAFGLRNTDSLIGSTGDPGRILGTAPLAVVDLVDPVSGAGGIFPNNIPIPGANNTDQAALQVTGTLNVQAAGVYEFEFRGDDGGRLRIDGQDVIVDDGWHGHGGGANGVSQLVFLTAGDHEFQFVNMEATGGWSAELSYAQQGNTQVLVGDPSEGIVANDMVVTAYKLSGNVDISNLAQTRQLIAGQLHRGYGTPVHGIASIIDFADGANGNFAYNDPFLTPDLHGDDYVVRATTLVQIPQAGDWTFGVLSDDGFGLQIMGADLLSTTNDNGSVLGPDGMLAFDAIRGQDTTLGVFHFDDPGLYPLELLYFERGGGAGLELFAAQGALTSFDPGAFRLVGDTGNGGLGVITSIPEPATMLLAAMGIAGLGGYIRRRRKA